MTAKIGYTRSVIRGDRIHSEFIECNTDDMLERGFTECIIFLRALLLSGYIRKCKDLVELNQMMETIKNRMQDPSDSEYFKQNLSYIRDNIVEQIRRLQNESN